MHALIIQASTLFIGQFVMNAGMMFAARRKDGVLFVFFMVAFVDCLAALWVVLVRMHHLFLAQASAA